MIDELFGIILDKEFNFRKVLKFLKRIDIKNLSDYDIIEIYIEKQGDFIDVYIPLEDKSLRFKYNINNINVPFVKYFDDIAIYIDLDDECVYLYYYKGLKQYSMIIQ